MRPTVQHRTLGVATAAVAAAVIAAGTPALAAPTHHHAAAHHHASHLQRVTVDGLVTAVHHRDVSVFASSSTVGRRTAHHTVVHLALGKHATLGRHLAKGYALHLVAAGHGSATHITVPHVHAAKLTAAKAQVITGTVTQVGAHGIVVAPFGRSHAAGRSHTVSIDTAGAHVSVDGHSGNLHRGGFVSVLGASDGASVVATRIDALSIPGSTVAGSIVGVHGASVTVHANGSDTTVSLGDGDASIPLFLNCAAAQPSQLKAHDRLVVVGVVTEEEEGFVPLLAYAFDGDSATCI